MISHKYALLVDIPLCMDINGKRWTDRLWHKDAWTRTPGA